LEADLQVNYSTPIRIFISSKKDADMQKARVALVEVCKQLEIAQDQVNDFEEATKALKKLHSDARFLLAILSEVDQTVIRFPKTSRAH
jgi:hypothetical protein